MTDYLSQTCIGCGGTGKDIADCWRAGSPGEIWRSVAWKLMQFIRCKADGVFDSANPWDSKCAGCKYERLEILSDMWHYRQAREEEP